MKEGSDRTEDIDLGHQGGGIAATVHWRSDLDLWMAFEVVKTRYWSAFGIGNPFESGSKSIVVEINSPFEGVDRRIGGVFMQDNNGRIYLGHRGSVGGGRLGIGKRAFMASMEPEMLTDIQDGDRVSEVLTIGALNAPNLPECVEAFVRQVELFKGVA